MDRVKPLGFPIHLVHGRNIHRGVRSTPEFRLIDLLVLILALAVGLAIARQPYLKLDDEMVHVIGGRGLTAFYHWAILFPCLTPMTFVLVGLGMFQPRAVRAPSILRPGLAACIAVSFALIFRCVHYLPYYLQDMAWKGGPIEPWIKTGEMAGYSVLGAWCVLVLAGRWKIGEGWLNRAGVFVGLIWVSGALGCLTLDLWQFREILLKSVMNYLALVKLSM